MAILSKNKVLFRLACLFVSIAFLFNTIFPGLALASDLTLPNPTQLVPLSDSYSFLMLKGMKFDPSNPLNMEFIIDTADRRKVSEDEASVLIKYFLAGLTIPEEELWVNMSPYEADKMITPNLAQTDLGKDLLSQDYILKQLSSSLTYPETEVGKDFWLKTYQEVLKVAKTTNIPINTFNKLWIVPDKALIHQNGNFAFIKQAGLKAMLEEDYLALRNNITDIQKQKKGLKEELIEKVNQASSGVVRNIILPKINQEINQGKNFATLRQIYYSLVLGVWFKKRFKDSIYSYYINQAKVSGIDLADKNAKDKIYSLYVEAFKKGVYNYTKAEKDLGTGRNLKRQYFSGGAEFVHISKAVEIEVGKWRKNQDGSFSLDPQDLTGNPNLATIAIRPGKQEIAVAASSAAQGEQSSPDLEKMSDSEFARYITEEFMNLLANASTHPLLNMASFDMMLDALHNTVYERILSSPEAYSNPQLRALLASIQNERKKRRKMAEDEKSAGSPQQTSQSSPVDSNNALVKQDAGQLRMPDGRIINKMSDDKAEAYFSNLIDRIESAIRYGNSDVWIAAYKALLGVIHGYQYNPKFDKFILTRLLGRYSRLLTEEEKKPVFSQNYPVITEDDLQFIKKITHAILTKHESDFAPDITEEVIKNWNTADARGKNAWEYFVSVLLDNNPSYSLSDSWILEAIDLHFRGQIDAYGGYAGNFFDVPVLKQVHYYHRFFERYFSRESGRAQFQRNARDILDSVKNRRFRVRFNNGRVREYEDSGRFDYFRLREQAESEMQVYQLAQLFYSFVLDYSPEVFESRDLDGICWKEAQRGKPVWEHKEHWGDVFYRLKGSRPDLFKFVSFEEFMPREGVFEEKKATGGAEHKQAPLEPDFNTSDYYTILGVSRDATPDEIKHAYRGLARKYHPGVVQGDGGNQQAIDKAAEIFKKISDAYEVLSDPAKRNEYDKKGTRAKERSWSENDWEEMFRNFWKDFSAGEGFAGSPVTITSKLSSDSVIISDEVAAAPHGGIDLERITVDTTGAAASPIKNGDSPLKAGAVPIFSQSLNGLTFTITRLEEIEDIDRAMSELLEPAEPRQELAYGR